MKICTINFNTSCPAAYSFQSCNHTAPLRRENNAAASMQSGSSLLANYNIAFCGLNDEATRDAIRRSNIRTEDVRMEPMCGYKIDPETVIILRDTIVNLNSDRLKPLANNLRQGEELILGRDNIPNASDNILKNHLALRRNRQNELWVCDLSTENNAILRKNTKMAKLCDRSFEFKKGEHYVIPSNSVLYLDGYELNAAKEYNILRLKNHEKVTYVVSQTKKIFGSSKNNDLRVSFEKCDGDLVFTNLGSEELVEFIGLDLGKYKIAQDLGEGYTHKEWMDSDIKLTSDRFGNLAPYDFWVNFGSDRRSMYPWKIHVYSDNEQDWRKLETLIGPYLQDRNAVWKTLSPKSTFEELNEGNQKGKAFTIYPRGKDEMADIAKDIDYLIRKNHLELPGTKISGDRKMGNSGRLFYRYDLKDGRYFNTVFDCKTDKAMKSYDALYETNRGEGKYLATGMTQEDDIWFNFNPSNPNSYPDGPDEEYTSKVS